MATIPEQPSKEHGPKFESFGPYFFSRISKEEGGRGRSDAPAVAKYDTYHIELSATGLGFLDVDNPEEDQLTKVGSATVSISQTHFRDSKDLYRSCKIEQLDVETGASLTKMQAFAAVLRRIQSFCIDHQVEHLAIVPVQGSCWFTGLLKPAGFDICCCERLDKHVGVNFQLCIILPTPPIEVPSNKAGGRREQESGAVNEGSPFSKRSLRQHQESGASPAAPQEVVGPEGLIADSSQPRVQKSPRGSPFEVQALDSIKNKEPAPSSTAKNTRPAAKVADQPGPLMKKVYCMYWIRKGECDYMQSGCKFKHEMPVDEETRQRIGLREIPSWFRESPEYKQFLQQVDRSAAGTMSGVGSVKGDTSTARSSGRGSGRRGSDNRSHRDGRLATTSRDPGSYAVQSPHENRHRSNVKSNTEDKTSHVGPASATKINSTNAVNTTSDRRTDREIYRPPGAMVSSGGSDTRAATRESSKIKDSSDEEPTKKQAKSRRGSRFPASSTHPGPFEEALPSSRSAADYAPSMLPARMKGRSSSPVSDANEPRAGPGLKKAKNGKSNGQASN